MQTEILFPIKDKIPLYGTAFAVSRPELIPTREKKINLWLCYVMTMTYSSSKPAIT
jgi:hypothetical protein